MTPAVTQIPMQMAFEAQFLVTTLAICTSSPLSGLHSYQKSISFAAHTCGSGARFVQVKSSIALAVAECGSGRLAVVFDARGPFPIRDQ